MASNYHVLVVNERESSIAYLQSYNSVVAKYDHLQGKMTLGRDWNFSSTTIRHLGRFIMSVTGRDIRGEVNIQKAIDIGMFQYDQHMK